MELTAALQKLGFTEYEARAYLALLKSPDITGYDASRVSGVPRAKIYEVLEGLEKKGAATSSMHKGKNCYRAVAAEQLLSTHLHQMKDLVNRLGPRLKQVAAQPRRQELLTVVGRRQVFDLVRELVHKAKHRLLITGFPRDLLRLESSIRAAKERGVREYILSFGSEGLDDLNTFHHSVSSLQYLQVAATGRWLAAVVDFNEAVLAQIVDQQNTSALWTGHPAILFGTTAWITHDITMVHLEKRFGSKLPEINKSLQELVPMWTLAADETDHHPTAADLPDPEAVFAVIGERIADNSYPSGTIALELTGAQGGSWYLDLKPEGGLAREGKPPSADLVIEMTADDFVALATHNLPYHAFMTRDRIKITGNINFAALLPAIFGGDSN